MGYSLRQHKDLVHLGHFRLLSSLGSYSERYTAKIRRQRETERDRERRWYLAARAVVGLNVCTMMLACENEINIHTEWPPLQWPVILVNQSCLLSGTGDWHTCASDSSGRGSGKQSTCLLLMSQLHRWTNRRLLCMNKIKVHIFFHSDCTSVQFSQYMMPWCIGFW